MRDPKFKRVGTFAYEIRGSVSHNGYHGNRRYVSFVKNDTEPSAVRQAGDGPRTRDSPVKRCSHDDRTVIGETRIVQRVSRVSFVRGVRLFPEKAVYIRSVRRGKLRRTRVILLNINWPRFKRRKTTTAADDENSRRAKTKSTHKRNEKKTEYRRNSPNSRFVRFIAPPIVCARSKRNWTVGRVT